MSKQLKFGLIGKNISYSFSKKYFSDKFERLNLKHCSYENFDLQSIDDLTTLLKEKDASLRGMNVTIPYKLDIFKYLDEIDEDAQSIGAVNTIKILENGKLKGFNTDVYGFEQSLLPQLKSHVKKALILGTGGASRAVAFVLDKLNIDYKFVSRKTSLENSLLYSELTEEIIMNHYLIINCSPVGTYPNIHQLPDIPYQFLSENHYLYDLIYNPPQTLFLSKGSEKGAIIQNGLRMLELQADKSWEIWTF